jgi:hypothetical protein
MHSIDAKSVKNNENKVGVKEGMFIFFTSAMYLRAANIPKLLLYF